MGTESQKEITMEIEISRRKGFMLYLQIAAAVVSLMLGMFNLSKESMPLVHMAQENYKQMQSYKQQQEAIQKANEISQINVKWIPKNHDGMFQYYSDPSERYWKRINNQGIIEYSENPQYQHVAQIRNPQYQHVAQIRRLIK
jgi:hypothetical protein